MNKVWIRAKSPVLGLLLLLSVFPILGDLCEPQEKSDNLFFKQENWKLQEKSNNVFLFSKPAKCIDGSNSFPE